MFWKYPLTLEDEKKSGFFKNGWTRLEKDGVVLNY